MNSAWRWVKGKIGRGRAEGFSLSIRDGYGNSRRQSAMLGRLEVGGRIKLL